MTDRTREHHDAALAMTTAFLDGIAQQRQDLDVLDASYGAAKDLDPAMLGAAFASITAALVRHIARLEGRADGQVWSDMAPILATIPPEN